MASTKTNKNKKQMSLFYTNFWSFTTLLFCSKWFLHSKGPKKCNLSLAEPWYETLHIKSAIFLIMAQPKTNCVFRTFRVKESFWSKKQSCITLKVGIEKWCLFFVFVCFSGRQIFTLSLPKRPNVFENSGP